MSGEATRPPRACREATAIIGALLTPQGRDDPYPLYAKVRALGPVSAIGGTAFLVTSYAAVSKVLRDPAFAPANAGPPRPEASSALFADAHPVAVALEAGGA